MREIIKIYYRFHKNINSIINMKQQGVPQHSTNDPKAARFLRKQYQKEGVDLQQDQENANFRYKISESIDKFAKKQTQKNIQKQVQYFGCAIQPFHMKNQQMLGQIDEEGYFVYSERGRGKNRDAWLNSVGQAEDSEVADRLIKKIKEQSRFKTVFQADDKINQNFREGEDDQQESNQQLNQQDHQESQNQSRQQQEKIQSSFSIQQLLELMISQLPKKINANNYMKKLKIDKKMEDYNKLLTLSNQYIEQTGDYDILTLKREKLQQKLLQIKKQNNSNEESDQLNWNQDQEILSEGQRQQQKQCKGDQEQDQDDIF